MKTSKRTLRALGVLVLFIGFVVTWQYSASSRGRLRARFDVRRGHYVLLGYGLPPPERSEYVRLLRERYGIEYRTVALCLVSQSLRSYADSYDEVSFAAANRRFGHDVFKECWDLAHRNWEFKRAAQLAAH